MDISITTTRCGELKDEELRRLICSYISGKLGVPVRAENLQFCSNSTILNNLVCSVEVTTVEAYNDPISPSERNGNAK